MERGKTVEYLLQFPISSRPVFLLEKNSIFLKKSNKADLTNLLLGNLRKCDIITSDEEERSCPSIKSDAIVIDFMTVARRLTAVELKNVSSFGALCQTIINIVLIYGAKSDEVHVILENYKEYSPKASERARRSQRIGKLCEVVADDQQLPEWSEFYSRVENKKSLQNFFVSYCINHYKSDKPLFLAGGLLADPENVHEFLRER